MTGPGTPLTAPLDRAEKVLRAACGDRLRTRFPLAPLTTFRIGGPAALFLEPDSDADLAACHQAVADGDVPYAVLGKGSNVLVSDEGFRGLVIRLGRAFRWAARDGERLTAGGAMPLPALSGVALAHDLGGLEFGVAIPASVGGAVRMNAGAHASSVSEVVERVELYRLAVGEAESVPVERVGYRYRGSDLPEDGVVTAASFRLARADRAEIRARMDEARDWRRRTQPLAEANCGSVFKNPPGDHAARLIESLGAKGMAVGGASVSTKHANFIVAAPGARAADVVRLIREVQELVADRVGVRLDPEVHLVGNFDLTPLSAGPGDGGP
ncbi:MAG: UDP-N-acetylmuramate dehydrogenase [Actinobacteria bacterium]|nr:UDP-N-acetylmuramate dehydrogenase [Actinomycetota bacterium]